MIIDLHTHTYPLSDDSYLKPEELITLAKRAGLDGICLTEHDFFWDEMSVAKLSRAHSFFILPGVEIATDAGHLLLFGAHRYRLGMHRAVYTRQVMDELGGVIILPHPFRKRYANPASLLEPAAPEFVFDLVDAVEVLNGREKDRLNRLSQELAGRLGLKGVGGSDAHSPQDIPSCATYFERKITCLEELIAELKAGTFEAVDLRHQKGR